MKHIITYLLIGTSLTVSSQRMFWEEGLVINDSITASNYVKVSASQYINSNTIDNHFVNALFGGSELTEDVKVNTIDRLRNNNKFGSDTKLNLSYYQKGKSLNWGLKFNTRDFINANLTEGTVGLLLEGNKYKIGEQLDLSGLSLNYFSYNQYGLLLEKEIQNKRTIGAQFSYISGYTIIQSSFTDSYLLTAKDGSDISVGLNGEIDYTKGNKSRISPFNNTGGALDLYFIQKAEKSTIYIAVNNIGFVSQEGGNSYTLDTAFTFSGVQLSSDLQLDSVLGANNYVISDTLIIFPGIKQTEGSGVALLPVAIKIGGWYDFSSSLYVYATAQYIINSNYIPKINVNIGKQFSFPLITELLLGYGGYSSFDIGFGLNYTIADKITAFYKMNYLENLIAPAHSTGQGNSFGLVLHW